MSKDTGARLSLDDAAVRALLTEAGFPCERIHEDTWRSRFRGRNASLPFLVHVSLAHVTFAVVPFLKSPEDPDSAERLYKRLLDLNHTLLMAKFSIDDDLDVVLSVEYPVEELDRSEFHDALSALSYYADRHFEELSALLL
jgi:hypothetical protein